MATNTRKRKSDDPVLRSIDPRTGDTYAEVPATPVAEVREAVERARKVQPEWAAIPPEGRARLVSQVRHRIYERADEIVRVVTTEAGKPEAEAYAHEVVPSIVLLQGLEAIAAKALKPQRISPLAKPRLAKLIGGSSFRIDWRPFGVVGAITPWNYPITNCFLGFASALLAGNTVVIKPSEVLPACGELVRDLLEPLPSGVATVVQGGADVGAALVDAPCDKISFIGSPATGRKICAAAAQHLTPVVMELGGKDAAIVCDDADLDLASSGILWGSFFNAGQTCCSIERIYVTDAVADAFKERLVTKFNTLRQGEQVGPVIFRNQLDIVRRQVDDALAKGARLLGGGPNTGRSNDDGSLWYHPTILENVNDEMDVLRHETFGPVVTMTRVRDEAEAVRRANEEAVNLTASVWTTNRRKGEALGAELKAGNVSVNQHAETPASAWGAWGGYGESGFGRLNGEVGLREFSVPVFVQKSRLNMKRLWWYPYDEPTVDALRAAAQMLGASTTRERLQGAGDLLKVAGRSIRNKI